jgi:antitoxin VapB
MHKVTTKPFKSGNSEAIRLPKDMAFGIGTEVEIERDGNVVTIRPRREKDWRAALQRLIDMPGPTTVLEREPFEAPDRPGL